MCGHLVPESHEERIESLPAPRGLCPELGENLMRRELKVNHFVALVVVESLALESHEERIESRST